MDTDSILKQAAHMRPSSFSVTEKQRYRAEKMLMRQFVIMKLQYQVPIYLSDKDMKSWLLAGRSFLEEFQEITKVAETRKLLVAELAWTSARRVCVDQMEKEVWEELEEENRLSRQLRRKVTLEGLRMFLSVIRPKAEQHVQTFLRHLSNKLLDSFVGSHTSKRSKLALLAKLQQTTEPLAPQVVDTALEFLLDEPEPLAEVRTSQTQSASWDSSLASALRTRAEAASAHTGQQLAEAVATCFCLNTFFTKARLLCICTSAARDMVKAVYKRFVDRSKTFNLMDFDESSISARESVVCAVQDIEDRVQSAAYSWALHQLERKPMAPELCSAAAEMRDEKDKEEKKGVRLFFRRMWKKMMSPLSPEE
ncbi:uncharacterized protein LOC127373826 [Dicentrarchus labrax]|uniref:uncharacterized protein LOC127373826 n=1 Tax=Dicentrarchus labrax TaxID=13489 RepID=UPI0021F51D31|nr:uncharacterized protein LOC127373826 [Dicentrarchus labrax]